MKCGICNRDSDGKMWVATDYEGRPRSACEQCATRDSKGIVELTEKGKRHQQSEKAKKDADSANKPKLEVPK